MSIIKHYPFLQSEFTLELPKFPEIKPEYSYDEELQRTYTIAVCYDFLLRYNMKHNIGFFTNGELVKHQMVGRWSDICYVQLYKFIHPETIYVIITSYIGSCHGCITTWFRNKINAPDYSIAEILRAMLLDNVSKCEVLYDETSAITAFNNSETRLRNISNMD
jgi:hypothetical protein